MKLFWILGLVMLLLVGTVWAEDTEDDVTYPQTYTNDTCPTTSTPSAMLYIFFGICIMALFAWADKSNFGAGVIVAGIAMVPYSFPLYACHIVWGLVVTVLGLLALMYGVFWKVYE